MTGKSIACGGLQAGDHHPLAGLVSSAITAGTLLVAFGLLALGVESFWIVFVVGFGGLLPVSLGVLETSGDGETDTASGDALEKLRERYARGEITHEEFERRVERLVATDSGTDGDTFGR